MDNLQDELQKIYDSEINVSISWMWDAGIDVKLGGEMNGFLAEGNVKTVNDILPWLQKAIAEHLDESTYHVEREKSGLPNHSA
jgi:hypothetical protein